MDPNPEMSVEQFGYKQELKRSLSVWDLIIYGLIFMVPIAPFGIYGYVAAGAQGMVPLAYLIGMVGMVFSAFSYARLSEAFPLAGSVYTYANRGIHSTVGFLAGWLITLDYLLVPALLYVVSGAALTAMFPSVPVVVWAVAFIVVNTLVNIRGIEFTARFNKVVLIAELIVLAIFVAVGVAAVAGGKVGAGFTARPFYDPAHFSLTMVMGAVSLAVLSFLGFDGISTLSEETKGGNRTVGRATVTALLMVGVLFVVQTYVAASIVPDHTQFTNLDVAFYQVAEAAGGSWLFWTCSLATAFSWGVANSLAAQAAVSRLIFSMARDQLMPKQLAKVHPKYQTPYVATLAIAGISLALVFIYQNRIADLTSLVNFGALTSFVILHLSVIVYFLFKQKSKDYFRHLLMPLLGMAVILFVLVNLDAASKTLGVYWLGLGVIYFLVLTFAFKRKPTDLKV